MYPHYETVESLIGERPPDDPVHCFRPQVVSAQARLFLDNFPGRVMYAVKSNPHPAVLDPLHAAGVRDFDTASLGEMALIRGRFSDAHCYYMHAVKSRGDISRAYDEFGIRHFVIDHPAELQKLYDVLSGSEVVAVARLATRSDQVAFDLSTKFGATIDEAAALLDAAADRGFKVGLCFHVGSQCLSPEAFRVAFADVRRTLEVSSAKIACLGVGGGFPVHYEGADPPPPVAFMQTIAGEFETLRLDGCELMCEPGRVLVAEGMSVLARVILRKNDRLYLNDGIYGSLHGMVIGVRFPVKLVRPGESAAPHDTAFIAYGPTCDGLDELPQRLMLPRDVREGDYLEFGCMGAYTVSLRTTFNGFYPDTFVTVDAPFRRLETQTVSTTATQEGWRQTQSIDNP